MKITITANRKEWNASFRTELYTAMPRLAADLEQYETIHVTKEELAAIDRMSNSKVVKVVNIE